MMSLTGKDAWFEATCFMCHDFFLDPVTIDCGHDFCQACILHVWKECTMETETVCPRCKMPVLRSNLKPNSQLAKTMRMVKWMCQGRAQVAEEGKICKEHRQGVKYFCKDHLVTFCCECEKSKEHLAHNAVFASIASIEYKDRVLHRLDCLEKEKEDIQMHKSKMEKEWQEVVQQVEGEKQRMMEEFNMIHLRITQQCNSWLARMKDAVQDILLKKSTHMDEISTESTKLEEKILELRKTYRQTPLASLQNIRSTLEMCEKKKIADLVPFPPMAKKEIWELQDFIALLPLAIMAFEAVLSSRDSPKKGPSVDNPSRLKLEGVSQAPQEN